LLMLGIVAAGVWIASLTPPGTPTRWASLGGLVVAVVVVALFTRRRR